VLDGRGPELAGGHPRESSHDEQPARRNHHGQQAHDECDVIRDVYEPGQSGRCRRHRCRAGRAHADAMHPEHDDSLGARGGDGVGGESTRARRHVAAHVHVGGRHHGHVPRADDREDSVENE